MEHSVRGLIKICGITRVHDALDAADAGADALGFNFYRASKRYVDPFVVGVIRAKLPRHILKVGLFVNAAREEIEQLDRELHFDLLQFHGNETPEFCARWGARVIRAIRLQRASDLAAIPAYSSAGYILLDASQPEQFGGTGIVCDWTLALNAAQYGKPIILAGGLTPDNVAKAVAAVHPFGVDVASGVELRPGIKDPLRIRAFIAAARAALAAT